MTEFVTVDEAISKGKRMVNYPVVAINFGFAVLTMFLSATKQIPFWGLAIGFVLGFILSWLWWSFKITKWRVWAFENVRNVHELKKRAIRERLIWPENNFLEKTEIWSAADKETWTLLQKKFDREDLFQDDLEIPDETIIYYSKGKNLFEMLLFLGCLLLGLYLIKKETYIFGTILSVVGAYFGYREYKQVTNKEPQIIINDKGISTISTEFYSWELIFNEDVIGEGRGENTRYYLVYGHPLGAEHLEIEDYDTDSRSLSKLLGLYRGRYDMKRRDL